MLKSQGNEVRTAKYSTTYSSWVYEHPDAVSALETQVDAFWTELTGLSDKKKLVCLFRTQQPSVPHDGLYSL
jgi:spectrin beta